MTDTVQRSPLQPCFVVAKGTRGVLVGYGTHMATSEAGAAAMEKEVEAGRAVRTGGDYYCWTWFGYLAVKPQKVVELVNPN